MPTPFYHLDIAESLLQEERLNADVHDYLSAAAPAFYFGNTAPDVQVIARIPREATHFFRVPPDKKAPSAWEALLQAHPRLKNSCGAQRAFIAGYLCHLQADVRWVEDIFLPIFGPKVGWLGFRRRLYLHNALRTYLDKQVLASLEPDFGDRLETVQPQAWLPFTSDAHLREWRNVIARQLHPGAKIETTEVFARRQGISAEEFQALVDSEEEMQAQVFARLPRQSLIEYRDKLIEENIALLHDFFDTNL